MKWVGLGLVVLLVGCSGPNARTHGPSPSPSAVAAVSPAATPTPPAEPTPSAAVAFQCRLPFLRSLGSSQYQAGFISFPSGAFAADPSAPSTPGYYDLAVSKWLPVGRGGVAPDGLHYAFMTGGNPSNTPGPPRLHVVDARTGAERILNLNLPGNLPYGVEDYAADGIYIGSGWEGTAFGYWRIDPTSGVVVALGTTEPLRDDGTGHAWRMVVDPRDPKPAPSAMSGLPLPDEIVRRDLKTGVDQTWFYQPGFNVTLAGVFVGGGILAWVEPPITSTGAMRHEYWLVSAPGSSAHVANVESGGETMADSHGIWMGGSDGLYLFTSDSGVRRVSDLLGDPENGCF